LDSVAAHFRERGRHVFGKLSAQAVKLKANRTFETWANSSVSTSARSERGEAQQPGGASEAEQKAFHGGVLTTRTPASTTKNRSLLGGRLDRLSGTVDHRAGGACRRPIQARLRGLLRSRGGNAQLDDQLGDFAARLDGRRMADVEFSGDLARPQAVGQTMQNGFFARCEQLGKNREQLMSADLGEDAIVGCPRLQQRGISVFILQQWDLVAAPLN